MKRAITFYYARPEKRATDYIMRRIAEEGTVLDHTMPCTPGLKMHDYVMRFLAE
jgi:hypothetical protein